MGKLLENLDRVNSHHAQDSGGGRIMIKKYSYREEDLKQKQMLPGLLGIDKKANLKRFVTAEDLSYRAGYARMEKDSFFESFYWYDEFWCVISGRGHVKTVNRSSGKEQELELVVKDLFFVSKGEWIKTTGLSEESFVFFYCAIPAASKDAPWLAFMTENDINDVKKRKEY